ncbi:MAG TPA: hypothetical protein VKU41_16810 [Polyangiaceae bacterium]|nr:hypothetical protein [Polyangiaceae bacterium]
MLERIALHQTRLNTPGLGLDSKGVALGAKGLLLLPSVDRLVALLAAYTRERSLEDLLPALAIHLAHSKLGTREVVVEFPAESSDRMDRMADVARLVGGFAFTGTSRHFVQYRDAAAPFGYDATDLLSTDAQLALYHGRFSQTYDLERPIDLRSLLIRIMPRLEPGTRSLAGPRIVVVEPGLGGTLVSYLLRSGVDGVVCMVEWPPANAFDDAPVRRWILRLPSFPPRMGSLLHETPGLTSFVPTATGVAVEAGYRHPIELQACPVFGGGGLVLLRGGGAEPWVVDHLPMLAPLRAFARVGFATTPGEPPVGASVGGGEILRVPLRVVASGRPWRNVTATWIASEQLPLLRRLAYALPHEIVTRALVAITPRGAFLRSPAGIEGFPGVFYVEVHPDLFVPAGHDVTPSVSSEALAKAVGAPATHVTFIGPDSRVVAIERTAFAPLEAALVEAAPWDALVAEQIAAALDEPIELKVTTIGLLPMRGVEPIPEGG